MKRALVLLLIALASTVASCSRGSGNEKRYDLKGKVVAVDAQNQRATIAHEEVKGYMPGMTMPFSVPKKSDFDMLVPNAEVTATLVVDGPHAWLENPFVVVKQETGTPVTTNGVVQAKEGDEVPNFTLLNQDGQQIRISNYRGKTLLLTFIYTRCPFPDQCTLMSNNFAQIERQLGQDPELYARTHLLSISIDPTYDEPKVLRSYGAAHTERYEKETFAHWEFATGTSEQVKDIAQYFGLTYFPEKDQIIHALRTAIVSSEGKVVKTYIGNEWKIDDVVAEIKQSAVR